MKMVEHNLNNMKQRLDAMNPLLIVQLETKLEEFQKDLYELRNLYSSPQSSLNRVLDGLLQKVKELEKHMFAPESMYDARYDSPGPGGDGKGNTANAPTAAPSNADTGNYYQNLTSKRRGND